MVAVAVTTLLAFGVPAAHATMPGENGKIAYTSTSPCCSIHTVTPSADPLQRNDTNLTPDQADAINPAWSPDGTEIAYSKRDSPSDKFRIWVMNQDGSGKTQLSQDPAAVGYDDFSPTWSPDGQQIAWVRVVSDAQAPVWVMNSDGTNAHQTPITASTVDWSPDGTKFALSGGGGGFRVANIDGTNTVFIPATGNDPSWSPSGNWLVYNFGNGAGATIRRITPDGAHEGPHQETGVDPVWSPDGRYIAAQEGSGIFVRPEGAEAPGGVPSSGFVVANNGWTPDWQPRPPFVTPPGYPRPRGAGPLDVSLVPAYSSCDAPNSTHGPPLSFGSCAPPTQTSSTLTLGTPDANGHGARSVGRAAIMPIGGTPSSPADARMVIFVSDVRCQAGGTPGCSAPLAPYSGSLRGTFDLTITDKDNGGSGVESATGKTLPYWQPALPVTVPCAPTADPSVGATCSVDTTASAIVGNLNLQGKRSTWAIGQVQLWDSGPDGNINSDDNTLFAVEGLFVP